jgi:IS5 family transposase
MSRNLAENPNCIPLFEITPLSEKLDQKEKPIILAKAINWIGLELSLSKFYSSKLGRPIIPIRRMIGLLLLQYFFNASDRQAVAEWKANVYWQAFTGEISQVDKLPCSASQLAAFRKRIGVEGCEIIFQESVRVHGKKVLEKTCIADTTVQEKNITFPTDDKLMLRAIKIIFSIAAFLGIAFRKKFKKETQQIKTDNNFSKSVKDKECKIKNTERLRVIGSLLLKTLIKHIPERALKGYKVPSLLFILKKVFSQRKNDKQKVYSIHEPQTQCIAKGKSYKKYEFGNKVSLMITKCSQIIVGVLSFSKNPYDGDTLDPALKQLETLHNGYLPKQIIADRGYRGREEVNGVKVLTPYDQKKGILSKVLKKITKLLRSRPSIEPIIGHLKADHRMSRNLLKGVLGDKINPLLSAAAFNFLKYARVEYEHLHRPPKPIRLYIKVRGERKKYHGLPLYNAKGTLF